MSKLWKIFGVLLCAVGLICIVICILREGQNQIFLSIGLLCNSLALLIYCFIINKQKK